MVRIFVLVCMIFLNTPLYQYEYLHLFAILFTHFFIIRFEALNNSDLTKTSFPYEIQSKRMNRNKIIIQ